jgi:hypothetical protein
LNRFGGILNDEPQIVEFEWLGKIIVSAGFDGFNRHALRAVSGDDDHERAVAVIAFDFTEEIEPAHSGKVYVEEEQVWFVLFE